MRLYYYPHNLVDKLKDLITTIITDMTGKGWCFTINNDTFKDLQSVVDLYEIYDYVIFGFEIGKKGTNHIQGYCFTRVPQRLTALSKLLPRAHITKANGTPQQNYDYCTKEGQFYEFGELPVQGKRTDIEDAIALINGGANYKELYAKYPRQAMMYSRGMKEAIQMNKPINETKYYVKKASLTKHEDIQEIHEYFDTLEKPAVVFDKLENIADYDDDYENVIFYPEEFKSEHSMFPLGYPITYKFGYERKRISPHVFVIITEVPKMYTSYKLI